MSQPRKLYVANVSKKVTDPEVIAMVTALNSLLPQFCADWSLRPARLEVFVPPPGAAAGGAKVPAGAAGVLYISDSPDIAGVYGYHDETDKNLAIAKVFTAPVMSNGGKVLAGGAMTVAQVFSHEVLELLADAQCNTWWQTAQGDLVAFEVCDPVQMNVVKVRTEPLGDVWCSDWILPAWADAQAKAVPLNHLNTLKAPFSCAKGGYLIRMAAGRSTAVFAAGAPQWLEDAKRAHAQRFQTRGAAAAAAVRGVTTTAGLLDLAAAPKHTKHAQSLNQRVGQIRSKLMYYERQNKVDMLELERLQMALQEAKERLAELLKKQAELRERQMREPQKQGQQQQQSLCGDPNCTCPLAKSLPQQIKDQRDTIAAAEARKAALRLRIEGFEDSGQQLKKELDKLLKELEAAAPDMLQPVGGDKAAVQQQKHRWF